MPSIVCFCVPPTHSVGLLIARELWSPPSHEGSHQVSQLRFDLLTSWKLSNTVGTGQEAWGQLNRPAGEIGLIRDRCSSGVTPMLLWCCEIGGKRREKKREREKKKTLLCWMTTWLHCSRQSTGYTAVWHVVTGSTLARLWELYFCPVKAHAHLGWIKHCKSPNNSVTEVIIYCVELPWSRWQVTCPPILIHPVHPIHPCPPWHRDFLLSFVLPNK